MRAIGGIELKEFHEDRAARLRTRCMARGRRIADVAARRIVAAIVLKDSVENEEFFAAEMRVMVSTSFPTKLIESLTAGRPILVCGPAYASVPRYFREYDLPLCARSLDGLETTLHDVEQQDRVTLIERYKATIRQLHSPRSLRQVLSDTWPGQGK